MRRRPSYANVTSTLALLFAVGTGGAWAASQIDGSQLKARSLAGSKIRENSITGKEVNESKLGTVTNARTVGSIPPEGFIQGQGRLTAGSDSGTAAAGFVVRTLPTPVGEFRLGCERNGDDASTVVRFHNTTPGVANEAFADIDDDNARAEAAGLAPIQPNSTRSFGFGASNRNDTHFFRWRVMKADGKIGELEVFATHTGASRTCTFGWRLFVTG